VFQRSKKSTIDVNRVVMAAMSSFMAPERSSENGRVESPERNHRGAGLGSVGAVAVGAALAVAARAAYSRARQRFDLEHVANAVEQKLAD
jgi:homoserine kinase